MLEGDNLKIADALYKDHPIPALLLAHQLMAIKGIKGLRFVSGLSPTSGSFDSPS
jgi:hypothetical protein